MKTWLQNTAYEALSLLKLSLFNVWRNRRRTVITLISICVGTITLVLMNGYIQIMQVGLKNEAIQKQYGNLQIARAGYFNADENSPDFYMDLKTAQKVKKKIQKLSGVDYINYRLQIAGIIGNQKRSAVFLGVCGMPDIESLMAPTLVEGKLLSADDPYGILLGKTLAKKLGVKLGDSLVLFVASESGSQEAIPVRVRGLYEALMKEQEKMLVYLPMAAGWDLLLDQKIHRMLVFFQAGQSELQNRQTTAAIEKIVKESKLGLEVKNWESLAVFFRQVIGMFKGVSFVTGLILFLIIAFNIQNTMHMSITERFREIGTLRAMGSSRFEIVRNFLTEGLVLGLMGAVIGIALSVSLGSVLNSMHLNLPPGPGQDKPTPLAFRFTAALICNAAFMNIIIAFIASYFPARRGAKIAIVDALK